MKFKRQILILPLFAIIIALCLLLTSCSLLDQFLNKKSTVAPTIVSVEQLKTAIDYKESKEYLYNKDSNAVMPLKSGESFLISITYENPSDYAISYVKVNNEKIMAAKFEDNSTKTNTIIKLKASESKTSIVETFTINSIFYVAGTETKRVPFNDEINMEFKVAIDPTYQLTLNYQNADRRAATLASDQKASSQEVTFNADLASFSVASADYEATAGLPTKPGGWVFEGYYTEPNGKGTLVTQKDKYYFWGNVTLYAHFSRLFTYEIVDLAELGMSEIVYNYSDKGVEKTKTFYKGAIITKHNKKGHPIIDIGNTLVDEVVNYNKDTGAFVNITATEYPIIKIGVEAFKDVNTMTNLTIGKYVEEISAYAFANCNKLERVTFATGSNLKYIGDCAFQDTKLMGISYPFALPDNVEYIGNFAFRSSGWKNTINNGLNESVLHIKPQYKFIGVECFFNTRFTRVIFDPGCYYEGQINAQDGEIIDDLGGWRSLGNRDETGILELPNKIGSGIFGNCSELYEVVVKGETVNDVYIPALNIIPDLAFDRENYTTTGLIALNINEGVTYIGAKAFTYQEKLQIVSLPSSLKEVDKKAFYNCTSVYDLNFREDRNNGVYSQLEILRSSCFGNMTSLVRVQILSSVFKKYGNGPFSNCDSLKSIEFPNMDNTDQIPKGFTDAEDSSEVVLGHKYSDFMYATFESGKLRSTLNGDGSTDIQTYAVPTRVFCKQPVLNAFKTELEKGKQLKAGGVETGNGAYRDSIFIYDLNLIFRDYSVDGNETGPKTDIALQAIYNYKTGVIDGYSMAFWSHRTKNIVIPSMLKLTIDGSQQDCTIIQIGSRSLPTSVQTVTIPSTVTRLQNDAFNNCTALTDVIFQNRNTLKYIGDNAFMGTLITSFIGGTDLYAIGQYAFWNCSSLRWVDLSASTFIRNNFIGRMRFKEQYIYDYERAAIEKQVSSEKDAIEYNNALYNGAFQGCRSLKWIYLPPNLERMSGSLLAGCKNLETVIIANENISTSTDVTDKDEVCFYPYNQATGVYDSEALAKGMTIYGKNIQNKHEVIFPRGNYKVIDQAPAHP